MPPSETEGLDTFFAMVGFFLMVIGFIGAILLMVVGIILELFYGDISVLGRNMFILVGLAFGAMAFVGIAMFMLKFLIFRKQLEEDIDEH